MAFTITLTSGIASAESFGTPSINQKVEPVGIASAESFGTLKVNQKVELNSVASAESVGTPQAYFNHQSITLTSSISSGESFGTLSVKNGYFFPTSVASAESFGTAKINQKIEPTSIAAGAVGTPSVGNGHVYPVSIASAAAFGTPQVNQKIEPVGIESAEAFSVYIFMNSVASGESFGTLKVNQKVEPTSIASAESFGTPTVVRTFNHTASGGMEMSGEAVVRHTYIASGFSSSGNAINLEGIAGSHQTLVFTEAIRWNVRATVSASQEIIWQTGKVPLRWYRITGCCRYPTEDGDGDFTNEGQPGGCDVIPFESTDDQCKGALGKNTFIQNIIAESVGDVCRILKELRWKWPICAMERFSRPAESQFIDDDDECNVLEPVEPCNAPECLEFCIDTDAVVNVGVKVELVDSFWTQPASEGGVTIAGDSEHRIVPPSHVGSGGIVLSGEAGFAAEFWTYTPDTQGAAHILTGGVAEWQSEFWSYTATGGIVLGGEATVVADGWGWVADGGIVMGGSTAPYGLKLPYIASGFGSLPPGGPAIRIEGEAIWGRFYYTSTGGVVIGGTSLAATTSLRYIPPDSGIVLAGEAKMVSPDWHYTPTDGGVTLGGTALSRADIPYWSMEATGGITLAGVADARHSGDGDWWYTGAGGITLAGEGITAVNKWWFIADSGTGVILGGEGLIDGDWDGHHVVSMGVTTTIESLEIVYYEQDLDDDGTLDDLSSTIATKCESCSQIPIVLNMSHNLADAAVLGQFLIRNGLKLDEVLPIRYNRISSSWQGNYHFRGVGDSGGTLEDWSIVAEWSCIDELGSINLGNYLWKFSLYIKRKNVVTGMDFDTRLLLGFPAKEICDEAARVGLDFSFAFDTQTAYVNAEHDIVVDARLLYDNIGLFRSIEWINDPDLLINIAEVGSAEEILRQDILPIFPDPVLGVPPTTPTTAVGTGPTIPNSAVIVGTGPTTPAVTGAGPTVPIFP